jgi:IPT/TIG domain
MAISVVFDVLNPGHRSASRLSTFTYGGQKWWAAGMVAGLLALIVLAQYALRQHRINQRNPHLPRDQRKTAMQRDRRGGLVMGADRRLSTSKAIAVLWTIVVGWIALATALIALTRPAAGTAWASILKSTPDLYLVLLGGPYAAAVLSKLSVLQYTAAGRLQKTEGPGTISPLDIISDDSGNTSVYDFQYVFFNLIVAIAVVSIFAKSTGSAGFPHIPAFAAILTGGAALTYTVSKGANINNGGDSSTTQPSISAVTPASASMGATVTIFGQNFCTPGAAVPPQVQLGDYQLDVQDFSDTRIDAMLQGLDQMNWPQEPLTVSIYTPEGRQASAPAKFTVI